VVRVALGLLPLILLVALALGPFGEESGGGGGGGNGGARSDPSVLPYPPSAAEPARSPALSRPPAGRVVRIGGPAEGVVADPETGLVAVARQDQPQLVLVDVGAGSVRRRVPLPAAPRHLDLARPGGPVLVPAEEADALVQVALPQGERTETTKVGDFPHDAAFGGGRAYTADEFGSTITAVQDGEVVERAPVDAQPGGIFAVGDELGIVSVSAYTLTLVGQDTLRGGGSQNAGSGPTHGEADAGGRIWVTDTRGNALSVFATRPRLKFIARVPLPGGSPYGIAVDRRRERGWVTLTGSNQLVELRASDRPRRLRTFPTVRQPNTVAVDEGTGRVVVASSAGDALQIIDP
jgi:DNA-binding beta-propeller fold protein YncE